jgi:hypothetical protein
MLAGGQGAYTPSDKNPNPIIVVNQNNIEPIFDGEKWILKTVTTSQTLRSDGNKVNPVTK